MRACCCSARAEGRVVAFDRDPEAVAAPAPADEGRGPAFFDPSRELPERRRCWLPGHPRGRRRAARPGRVSPQIDDPARGFSFRFDGPLDMRMDTTRGESAADFLARADERQIAEVIRDYGEERFAGPIAKALVARREGGDPVRTTGELSELVAGAVKTREAGQDPATRTFQALRIFVNAELEELEQALNAALELLAPGGRLVVIASIRSKTASSRPSSRARARRVRPPRAVRRAGAAAPEGARPHQAGRDRNRPTRAPARRSCAWPRRTAVGMTGSTSC